MAKFTPYSYRGTNHVLFEPTAETIAAIAEAIEWSEKEVPTELHYWTVKLTEMMAFLGQGYARKMSFGPEDPTGKNKSQAWKIPVRRISGKYYLGWKVRPIRDGWQVYNDSREAYFIEFGINRLGEGRRVRRPVRKIAFKQTIDYMMTTKAFDRIWANIMQHHGKGYGFSVYSQSPKLHPGFAPGGLIGRELP